MRNPKFSVNALLVVFIVFSAMIFFFIVKLTGMADRSAINEFIPIEGTDFAIRYSSLEPDGIYEGSENVNTLRCRGTFGYDWGSAREGNLLYLNEYHTTDLGFMICDLVCVDLNSFEKQTILKDAILRGTCASGELVCVQDLLLPSNAPETNSLCRMYSLSSARLRAGDGCATVLFLDPKTAEILYLVQDSDPMSDDFSARYLEKTLQEVTG